jgi:hypothetical protein
LEELVYEAILVMLWSDDCFMEVEDIVGGKFIIWCSSDWRVLGQSLPHFNGRDCCGFVDGWLMGKVMVGLVNGMPIVHQVVRTKCGCQQFKGWVANSIRKWCTMRLVWHHGSVWVYHVDEKDGGTWEGEGLPFVVGRYTISPVLLLMEMCGNILY